MYFESVSSANEVFDFGIVTRGPVSIRGSSTIAADEHASILSLSSSSTPFTLQGNVSVSGDLYLSNPNGNVSVSGKSSIGGASTAAREDHIHRGVEPPALPGVNTQIFLPYVQSTYQPGKQLYRNVLVPPNTNPTFNNKVVIEGVLYIKHPNQVRFSGQATVRGIIVVESGAAPGPQNTMTFRGGFDQYGIETLTPGPDFPADLLALRGSALLAPGFSVSFGGNSGSVGGTMVAESFQFQGNSGGTIAGSLIAYGDVPLEIHGSVNITRRPSDVPFPAGLVFDKTFRPLLKTYTEIRP
jgi:filamentous hemagglutinin family protein